MVPLPLGPARESEGAICSTFVDSCCRALRIALRHVHERVSYALGAGWDVMSARVCPRDQLAADASYSLLGCCCFAIALRYSSLTSYLLRTYFLLTSHLLLTYFRLTFTPHRNLILPRRAFSSHTYFSRSNFFSHTYLSHINFSSHTYLSYSISFGDHAREPMAHAMFDSYQSLGVDLGIELVWPLQVIARDIAEMQLRCSRDAVEMQSRCSRDAAEMQPR